MKVYLRHESSTDNLLLTELPNALDLEELVSDMRLKGVFSDGSTFKDIDYQYVLDDENAYAEVILHGEGE